MNSLGLKINPELCSNICLKVNKLVKGNCYVVPCKKKYIILQFEEKTDSGFLFKTNKLLINVPSRNIYELALGNNSRFVIDNSKIICAGSIIKYNACNYVIINAKTTEIDGIIECSVLRPDYVLENLKIDLSNVIIIKAKKC